MLQLLKEGTLDFFIQQNLLGLNTIYRLWQHLMKLQMVYLKPNKFLTLV